jgi:hypothetical protein
MMAAGRGSTGSTLSEADQAAAVSVLTESLLRIMRGFPKPPIFGDVPT